MPEKSSRFNGKTPSRIIQNESREDYLEAIYLLSGDGKRPIRSFELAEHMGMSKPSVCRAVAQLRQQEYVDMDDSYYITLTEKGAEDAKRIYAKHTYFKAMLMHAGVEEDIAEKEACRIEHIVSDMSFEKIKATYIIES